MTFTTDAWARTADVRSAIDELPFVQGLADGTLGVVGKSRQMSGWT